MNDEIRNTFIALSSMVPVVGGSISFLLDKYLPSEAERRRSEFLQQLTNDVERLKDRIDIKNLETPEFQSVFVRLLRASIEEHRQEKLLAFRNISLNLLMDPRQLSFNQAEFYMRLSLILIPDEIKILHIFYLLDVKGELSSYDDKSKPRDIYRIIEQLSGSNERDYIRALITDCMRYELIASSTPQKEKYLRDGIFITELGNDFVDYIFNPIEVDLYGL